jgi:hypothetical protein
MNRRMNQYTPPRGPIHEKPTISDHMAAAARRVRAVAAGTVRLTGLAFVVLSWVIMTVALVSWPLWPLVGAAMGADNAGQMHLPIRVDVGVAATVVVAMFIRVMVGVVEGLTAKQPDTLEPRSLSITEPLD